MHKAADKPQANLEFLGTENRALHTHGAQELKHPAHLAPASSGNASMMKQSQPQDPMSFHNKFNNYFQGLALERLMTTNQDLAQEMLVREKTGCRDN